MSISSLFNPSSPYALPTLRLFLWVLVLMAGVFAVVTALVLYSVFRFRSTPGDGDPPAPGENPGMEIAWIGGAAVLLLVLLIPTVVTMREVDPPAGARSPDLVVIGHQWWWEVRYPRSGAVAANEIHLPVRRPFLVRVESADVIHDFWLPQLTRKIDMTPGHPDDVWLEADGAGVYLGACVEYCGAEHAWMRLRVIAEPEAAFEAWLQDQRRPAPPPTTPEALAGARLFRQDACESCHAAGIAVGPDLSHVAGRETLAGGVLANTPANLARWLADPQAVKPGSLMPNFHLTSGPLHSLVAYLETLK
jgi:cytochrome c oxidase subunit II